MIFGYLVSEAAARRINMLMTDPFDVNHDSFLENYLDTLEPRVLN